MDEGRLSATPDAPGAAPIQTISFGCRLNLVESEAAAAAARAGGMEGGMDRVGQGPGGAVAGEGPGHGTAVAEEEDVRGPEEQGVHWIGGKGRG